MLFYFQVLAECSGRGVSGGLNRLSKEKVCLAVSVGILAAFSNF